jgi:hypothetical protein
VGFDLKTGAVVGKALLKPPALLPDSHMNGLRVDLAHGAQIRGATLPPGHAPRGVANATAFSTLYRSGSFSRSSATKSDSVRSGTH